MEAKKAVELASESESRLAKKKRKWRSLTYGHGISATPLVIFTSDGIITKIHSI
jgi:hypothetical protein